jgi:hypothetical protein
MTDVHGFPDISHPLSYVTKFLENRTPLSSLRFHCRWGNVCHYSWFRDTCPSGAQLQVSANMMLYRMHSKLHNWTFLKIYLHVMRPSSCWLVGIAMKLQIGRPGFDSRQGWDFSLLQIVQIGSGDHRAPSTMHTGSSIQGVKRQGREADNSPASTAEIKNGGAIPLFLNASPWCSS